MNLVARAVGEWFEISAAQDCMYGYTAWQTGCVTNTTALKKNNGPAIPYPLHIYVNFIENNSLLSAHTPSPFLQHGHLELVRASTSKTKNCTTVPI